MPNPVEFVKTATHTIAAPDPAAPLSFVIPDSGLYKSFIIQLVDFTFNGGNNVNIQISLDGTNFVTEATLDYASDKLWHAFLPSVPRGGIRVLSANNLSQGGTILVSMTDTPYNHKRLT